MHELSPEHAENDAFMLCDWLYLAQVQKKCQRQQLHMPVKFKFYVVKIVCRLSYHPLCSGYDLGIRLEV